MTRYIENSGKRLGSSHHFFPASWKKGKTFLEDEYFKNIKCTSDENNFYFRCPHNLKLQCALCLEMLWKATCSCVSGKTGYCNHSLALMLKLCKFSLFESKITQDLVNDADQNPEKACTSRLQTWHRKGRGDAIEAQPVMDIIVKRKMSASEKQEEGINCLLYEARNNVTLQQAEQRTFKDIFKENQP